jgi:5-methylthioadenosine/S-adenosylhomocysteine deaminase
MTRMLIQGGRVLSPNGELDIPPLADVLIEDDRILDVVAPGTVTDANAQMMDAAGKLVMPGFVNAHYHSADVLFRGCFEQLPLEAWGLFAFPSSYSRRSAEEVRVRTALGAAENLRAGVTTLQDMASLSLSDPEQIDAIFEGYADVGARTVLAVQIADRAMADTVPFWREDMSAASLATLPGPADLAPIKALMGDLIGRTLPRNLTLGIAPSAPQRCTEDLLRWSAEFARAHDLPIFSHVYETKSQAVLARIAYAADGGSLIRHLARMGLLTSKLTIAHGVWIDDDEIALLAEAGATLSCNPMSNLKLMNGAAPVRAYARAGANIALGSDNCSCSDAQNIFEAMKMFALYWGLQGEAGETGAAKAAFRAATLGGAKAVGLAGRIGAIEPGFKADLLLLDATDTAFVPLNSAVRQLVYAATPRSVHSVMVGGKVVVEAGRLVSTDEAALHDATCACHRQLAGELATVRTRMKPVADEIFAINRRVDSYDVGLDRYRLRG